MKEYVKISTEEYKQLLFLKKDIEDNHCLMGTNINIHRFDLYSKDEALNDLKMKIDFMRDKVKVFEEENSHLKHSLFGIEKTLKSEYETRIKQSSIWQILKLKYFSK